MMLVMYERIASLHFQIDQRKIFCFERLVKTKMIRRIPLVRADCPSSGKGNKGLVEGNCGFTSSKALFDEAQTLFLTTCVEIPFLHDYSFEPGYSDTVNQRNHLNPKS